MLRSSIVFLISALALGQQPNTPAASMTVDGVSGPPYPIATSVRTNTTATVAVSGAAGAPFIIALSATGIAQPGAALTGGGLVDLPLVPAPVIAVQAALDASGTSQLSVLVPPPGTPPAGIPIGHQEALQGAVSDPLSPAGFTLTALTQVSVIQGPIVVNLALGSDGVASINLAPHGFSIPFYGTSYNQIWVCVNGFLTFGSPDSDFSPTVLEFNTGAPPIAAFWSDLEQQPAAPWQAVRYTIDPAPPGGQPPFVQAEWINIPDWGGGSQFFHTFSTKIDALGVCKISYQALTAPASTRCSAASDRGWASTRRRRKISPRSIRPATRDRRSRASSRSIRPAPGGGWPSPFDLFGQVLTFQPSGGGSVPASTVSYMMY